MITSHVIKANTSQPKEAIEDFPLLICVGETSLVKNSKHSQWFDKIAMKIETL